jgi:hypothetical protein
MSKIDLSKAKIGDKFRTEFGYVVKLIGLCRRNRYKYLFEVDGEDLNCCYDKWGEADSNHRNEYRLVEQVLDKPLDELIEEGTKRIKENDDVIAEENELQRRQEVVELAEKMYIMFENEILRCNLSYDGSSIYCPEDLMEKAITRAAFFIKKKNEYLKEGK